VARGAILAAMLTMLAGASPAAAQPASEPSILAPHGHGDVAPDELALRRVLARYSSGDIDGAAQALLQQPHAWATAAVDAAAERIDADLRSHLRGNRRLGETIDGPLLEAVRRDRLRLFQLAASLHVEAACRLTAVDPIGQRLLAGERAVALLVGLRADLDANGPVPWTSVQDYVARWYAAAVARLQALVETRLAPALIARGLERVPDDPALLLARGSHAETTLMLARVDGSFADALYSSDERRRWRDSLIEAAAIYARRLRAGDDAEATIRLARVEVLLGRHADARTRLGRVAATELPAELHYLACLVDARAAEAAGAWTAAADRYAAALRAWPQAPTPMLALSRIESRAGNLDEARRWAELALGSSPPDGDPWRRYIRGQAWRLDERIAALRRIEWN
jgi:tetratricopeptide (TPR) repeat protein